MTPQCEVFWALLSSFKHSGVLEDSKFPTLGVLGFTPTLGQSGVVTAKGLGKGGEGYLFCVYVEGGGWCLRVLDAV